MIDGLTTFPCDMREFLLDVAAKFKNEIGVQRLPPVRSLHLVKDFVPQTMDALGINAQRRRATS
eukprot:7157321-Heterocapsa_arctica.AAC.1